MCFEFVVRCPTHGHYNERCALPPGWPQHHPCIVPASSCSNCVLPNMNNYGHRVRSAVRHVWEPTARRYGSQRQSSALKQASQTLACAMRLSACARRYKTPWHVNRVLARRPVYIRERSMHRQPGGHRAKDITQSDTDGDVYPTCDCPTRAQAASQASGISARGVRALRQYARRHSGVASGRGIVQDAHSAYKVDVLHRPHPYFGVCYRDLCSETP